MVQPHRSKAVEEEILKLREEQAEAARQYNNEPTDWHWMWVCDLIAEECILLQMLEGQR